MTTLNRVLVGISLIWLSGCSETEWETTIRETNELVDHVKNLETATQSFWLEKEYGLGEIYGWAPTVLVIGFGDNKRECLVIKERFERDGGSYRCKRADIVTGVIN